MNIYTSLVGRRLLLLGLACLLFALAGCTTAAEPTPTAVAIVEESPTDPPPSPTATDLPPTETPTSTPDPTDTPTPTPTDTPTPTPTDTPTPTPTDTPEPTETPEPTATAVPPTAVPPTAAPATQPPPPPPPASNAHTFPETTIRPFDVDDFQRSLGLVRDSFRSFDSEIRIWLETDKAFDCGTFNGWSRLWIIDAAGYTDVPAAWQPIYTEYRSMLRDIGNTTAEVRGLCQGEGGMLSEDTTISILAFISWAYPRSEQMVGEAAQLPRP